MEGAVLDPAGRRRAVETPTDALDANGGGGFGPTAAGPTVSARYFAALGSSDPAGQVDVAWIDGGHLRSAQIATEGVVKTSAFTTLPKGGVFGIVTSVRLSDGQPLLVLVRIKP